MTIRAVNLTMCSAVIDQGATKLPNCRTGSIAIDNFSGFHRLKVKARRDGSAQRTPTDSLFRRAGRSMTAVIRRCAYFDRNTTFLRQQEIDATAGQHEHHVLKHPRCGQRLVVLRRLHFHNAQRIPNLYDSCRRCCYGRLPEFHLRTAKLTSGD